MPVLARYYQSETLRLRLLLKRHVAWLRTRWTVQDEAYQGAAIPNSWADLLLDSGLDPNGEEAFAQGYPGNAQIDEYTRAVQACRETMPIGALARAFDLTPFDCDLLLLTLAPELDPSIEILFAYAMDDVTRKYATAQLGFALFTSGYDQRFAAHSRLEESAPLIRFELLRVEPATNAGVSFHSRPLRIDPRIREFLLGAGGPDARLGRLTKPTPGIAMACDHEAMAGELFRRLQNAESASFNLTGPMDSGKILLARDVYSRLGRTLVQLDPNRLPYETEEREALLRVAAREARLGPLAYYLLAPEFDASEKQAHARFMEFVERLDAPVAIDTFERWNGDRNLLPSPVERPGRGSQKSAWAAALGEHGGALQDEIASIVEQFDLGPEGVARAAEEVLDHAVGGLIHPSHLWRACRTQCSWRMEDLAHKLSPAHTWDDIVLTPDTHAQLIEIAAQVSRRAEVYERWGFARRTKRGRGISALFSGASGVGKTMAAEVLANHLELDLYRIDLAGVVSKYIGETEKNLRRIFDAAEQSGAILFFDEADALFGKRSEVKDSHDRYANIEINYLLQRMEEYRGLAVLATNRKTSLDRAFLRRLRFLVDFPFPDTAHRRQIWAKSFPAEAPVGILDLDFLSRLEITGGNIRNVALNAAFLAAERGGAIEFDDVLHAVRREYSKIDKLVTESEFGSHYGGKR